MLIARRRARVQVDIVISGIGAVHASSATTAALLTGGPCDAILSAVMSNPKTAAVVTWLCPLAGAVILLLQVVSGPLTAFAVLHEAPQLWTILGGLCLITVLAAHELAAGEERVPESVFTATELALEGGKLQEARRPAGALT